MLPIPTNQLQLPHNTQDNTPTCGSNFKDGFLDNGESESAKKARPMRPWTDVDDIFPKAIVFVVHAAPNVGKSTLTNSPQGALLS